MPIILIGSPSKTNNVSYEMVQNGVCVDKTILSYDRDAKTEDDARFNFTDCDYLFSSNTNKSIKRKKKNKSTSFSPLAGMFFLIITLFCLFVI